MRNPLSRWQSWSSVAHLPDTSIEAAWAFVTGPDFWLTYGADVISADRPAGREWHLTRQDGSSSVLSLLGREKGFGIVVWQNMGVRVADRHSAAVRYAVRLADAGSGCDVIVELRLRRCLHLTHLDLAWPDQAVGDWADRVEVAHRHGAIERTQPAAPVELEDERHVCYDWEEVLPYPADRVWRVVTDPELTAADARGVRRTQLEATTPDGVGAATEVEYADGSTVTFTVTRLDPPWLVEVVHLSEAGPVPSRYLLETLPEGTRIRATLWRPSGRPGSLHIDGRQTWASTFRHYRDVLEQGLDL